MKLQAKEKWINPALVPVEGMYGSPWLLLNCYGDIVDPGVSHFQLSEHRERMKRIALNNRALHSWSKTHIMPALRLQEQVQEHAKENREKEGVYALLRDIDYFLNGEHPFIACMSPPEVAHAMIFRISLVVEECKPKAKLKRFFLEKCIPEIERVCAGFPERPGRPPGGEEA